MTANEFLKDSNLEKVFKSGPPNLETIMIKFAQYHVKKALKQANKEFLNQHLEIDDRAFDKMGEIILDLKCQKRISKDILNAYPESNIV